MKLMWLGYYLVYIVGNCVIKLCIETDLIISLVKNRMMMYNPFHSTNQTKKLGVRR